MDRIESSNSGNNIRNSLMEFHNNLTKIFVDMEKLCDSMKNVTNHVKNINNAISKLYYKGRSVIEEPLLNLLNEIFKDSILEKADSFEHELKRAQHIYSSLFKQLKNKGKHHLDVWFEQRYDNLDKLIIEYLRIIERFYNKKNYKTFDEAIDECIEDGIPIDTSVIRTDKFSHIFESRIGCYYFRRFLKVSMNEDYIIFIRKAAFFRNLVDPVKIKKISKEIFDDFISETGSKEVNIHQNTRKKIATLLEEPTIDQNIFDSAVNEIFSLLKSNGFYEKFLENKEKENLMLRTSNLENLISPKSSPKHLEQSSSDAISTAIEQNPAKIISKWLSTQLMEKYTTNFLSAGFFNLENVKQMENVDIEALNIADVNEKEIIVNMIKNLSRNQIRASIQSVGPNMHVIVDGPSFDNVMERDDLMMDFEEYCSLRDQLPIFNFYRRSIEFRNLSSVSESTLHASARAIYEEFLIPNSEFPIPLSFNVKQEISSKLYDIKKNVIRNDFFLSAEDEIKEFINENILPKYLLTMRWKTVILQDVESQKQTYPYPSSEFLLHSPTVQENFLGFLYYSYNTKLNHVINFLSVDPTVNNIDNNSTQSIFIQTKMEAALKQLNISLGRIKKNNDSIIIRAKNAAWEKLMKDYYVDWVVSHWWKSLPKGEMGIETKKIFVSSENNLIAKTNSSFPEEKDSSNSNSSIPEEIVSKNPISAVPDETSKPSQITRVSMPPYKLQESVSFNENWIKRNFLSKTPSPALHIRGDMRLDYTTPKIYSYSFTEFSSPTKNEFSEKKERRLSKSFDIRDVVIDQLKTIRERLNINYQIEIILEGFNEIIDQIIKSKINNLIKTCKKIKTPFMLKANSHRVQQLIDVTKGLKPIKIRMNTSQPRVEKIVTQKWEENFQNKILRVEWEINSKFEIISNEINATVKSIEILQNYVDICIFLSNIIL